MRCSSNRHSAGTIGSYLNRSAGAVEATEAVLEERQSRPCGLMPERAEAARSDCRYCF